MKWLPFVLLAALPAFVAAPRQATSAVGGIVVGVEGRPVRGAAVAVAGTTRGDLTDADGRFFITQVPSGPRVVRATRVGYRETTYRVELPADDTVRIALRLSPADPEGGPPRWRIDPQVRPRPVPIAAPLNLERNRP